ncbi:MAG: hypothetical protein HAW67_06950 [Endozoicomonadaceae bacterium]|nr:hypothetical protein [Endozoicomonadaceae bacterium]
MSEDYNKKATDSLIIFVGIIGLIIALIWFVPQIYQVPWWLFKKAEIEFSLFFPSLFDKNYLNGIETIKASLAAYDIGDYRFNGMMKADNYTFGKSGWIINVLILLYGLRTLLKNKETFKTRHNVETLLEETSKYWRFQRYLLSYNPLKLSNKDVTKTNSRVRDKPIDYLTKHEALTINNDKFKINRKQLAKIGNEQMGEKFTDMASLKRHEIVVMAILAIVITRDTSSSTLYNLLSKIPFINKFDFVIDGRSTTAKFKALGLSGDMAECYNSERAFIDVENNARSIMKKLHSDPKIKECFEQHAYVYTLLRRMLIEARRSLGVFPAAYFGWIAIEDRTLYVSMHDEGMAEAGVEAFMIKDHLQREMGLKKAVWHIDTTEYENNLDIYLRKRGLKRGK